MGRAFWFWLTTLSVLLLACSRETETSKLRIDLPASGGVLKSSVQAQAGGFNTSLDPTSVSDINCYGVFVGGPEQFMNINNCSNSETGQIQFHFGPSALFFPAGSAIELDVPSGPNRLITLGGLVAQNGACQAFPPNGGGEPDSANLSFPHIISQQVVNLEPGEVDVTMIASLDTNKKFDDCSFFLGGGGGGGGETLFGTGADGSITVSTNFFSLLDSTYGHASVTRDAVGSAGYPNSKKISTAKRITNISADGRTLTLYEAITSNDFQVGDEILWHVSAGAVSSGSPDDDSCGTNSELFRGRFEFAIVTATTGSTITIDKPVSPSPSNINNANLASTQDKNNQNWCRMQAVRVPNFDVLTVPAGIIVELNGPAYIPASGDGHNGILAFRAKEVVANNTLTINMSGSGFSGGAAGDTAGDSLEGIASGTGVSNGAGGKGATGLAGGGGHGGDGGDGDTGTKGLAITNCVGSQACLPIADKKFMFGGGGGRTFSGTAGIGGGAIILHIGKISGSSNVTIKSNGTSGTSGNGGGAGGAVHLTLKEKTGGGTLTVEAKGGTSASAGAGGGGVAEVKYCASKVDVTPSVKVDAGATSTAGSAGRKDDAPEPGLCNAQ